MMSIYHLSIMFENNVRYTFSDLKMMPIARKYNKNCQMKQFVIVTRKITYLKCISHGTKKINM